MVAGMTGRHGLHCQRWILVSSTITPRSTTLLNGLAVPCAIDSERARRSFGVLFSFLLPIRLENESSWRL